MKKYLITNPRFTGEAIIYYNETGLLEMVDLKETDMDYNTRNHFKNSLPVLEANLSTSFSASTIVVQSDIVITFEQFWKKYDYKFHKDRAEQLWGRLSKSNQVLAYYAVDKYAKFLRKNPTQSKLHPDTFLRNKAWLNDYK